MNELCSFIQQVCAASSTNIGGLAASAGRSMTATVTEEYKEPELYDSTLRKELEAV